MTDPSAGPDTRRRRPWMPWAVVGSIALAAIATGAILVSTTLAGAGPLSPSPTPPRTASALPSATPTCTVSSFSGTSYATTDVPLAADGILTETTVGRFVPAGGATSPEEASISDVSSDRAVALFRVDGRATTVAVFDTGSGALLWQVDRPAGDLRVISTPAYSGIDSVLVLGDTSSDASGTVVTVFDVDTGQVVAERDFPNGLVGVRDEYLTAGVSVPARDGFIVVDAVDGSITRLHSTTLETSWTIAGGGMAGTPSIAGDLLLTGGQAYGLTSGERLSWSPSPVDAKVVAMGGSLIGTTVPYIGGDGAAHEIWGWDAASGERCWTRSVMSIAGDGETLWALDESGHIVEIDPRTGAELRSLGPAVLPQPRLELVGGVVMETGASSVDGEYTTVLHFPDGSVVETGMQAWWATGGNGQIVIRPYATATLTAFDVATGVVAWTAGIPERVLPNGAAYAWGRWEAASGSTLLSIWR